MYQYILVLIKLLQKEDQHTLVNVLKICKPGIISKSSEVSEWSLRFYEKLGIELKQKNLLVGTWDWFIEE